MYGMKNTKENRLKIREMEFNRLAENGHKKEAYKDVVFFTKNDDGKLFLNVFIGTSTKQENRFYYRSEERRQEVIDGYKKSADYREQRKKDTAGNKKLSSQAAAAKAIREELKTKFPGIAFSVTSECFSGGNSVDISWTDGPTVDMVEKISKKYQYGHFDGMTDMYEHTNNHDDIPQAKYVQTSRQMSEATREQIKQYLREMHQECECAEDNAWIDGYNCQFSTLIYREFYKLNLFYANKKHKAEYVDFEKELLSI
jgi:hypothetical protein